MSPLFARIGRAALAAALVLFARPGGARAQTACGTPGKDGPGGTLSGVVNTYFPGSGTAAAGGTAITVAAAISGGAATAVAPGDLLLVIQVQDATINSSNTSAYGSNGASGSGLTSTGTAGRYEYVVATSALSTGGGTVSVRGASNGGLLYGYASTSGTTTPRKRFQVIRVPQYSAATFGSGLTAAAWNGSAGGVLAVDVAGRLTLGGTVSVDGLGFRGGAGRMLTGGGAATTSDYVNVSTVNEHGQKGEGVAGSPRYTLAAGATAYFDNAADVYPGGATGRGAPGNAGGGGTDGDSTSNQNNSGGGGGAGAGAGGQGGRTYSNKLDDGGRGGTGFAQSETRLVLGGGGGAGSTNNGTGSPASGLASSGAAGGGIVLVRAGSIAGSGTITANGAAANSSVTNDGSGGGGGGGSILVYSAAGGVGTLTVQARGGAGGTNTGGGTPHGPGGGGGGGFVVLTGAPTSFDASGGASGTTVSDATYGASFGATAGTDGTVTSSAFSTPGSAPSAACVASLTVAKSTSTASVTAGNQATYTITVSNAASRDSARQLSVLDTLPAGMRFVSANAPTLTNAARPATVAPAANDTVLNFGTFSVAGGGSVSITFTVSVAYTAAPGTRQNSATAVYLSPTRTTAAGTATAAYNGTSSSGEDVTVTGVPDLRVAKTHAGSFVVGRSGAYTIAVSNAGTAATSGTITVTDTLPAGLAYASSAGTGWTCTPAGQVISCISTTAVANGGAAAAITLNVSVAASAPTSLTNTARVSGGNEPSALATDNASSDPTTVNRVDLAVALTDSGKTFVVGQSGYYTATVRNAGTASPFAASTVTLTLPTGLTYTSAAGTGWTCSSSSAQAATCTRSDTLAPAAAWPALRVQAAVAAAAVPRAITSASVATSSDVAAANDAASDTTAVVTVGLTVTPNGGVTDRLPSRGGAVTYSQTYVVTNTGSASDTFTLAASLAPGASASVATTNGQTGAAGGAVTLAANASANVVVTYTIADGATAGATDTVRLSATSGTAPSNSARGYAVARVVRAGLQLTKQAYRDDGATPIGTSDRVLPGEYVRYKITASSAGTADAVTVSVVDPIPAQLTVDSYTTDAAGWTIAASNGTLTANLSGALAVGQIRYFWVRVRVR